MTAGPGRRFCLGAGLVLALALGTTGCERAPTIHDLRHTQPPHPIARTAPDDADIVDGGFDRVPPDRFGPVLRPPGADGATDLDLTRSRLVTERQAIDSRLRMIERELGETEVRARLRRDELPDRRHRPVGREAELERERRGLEFQRAWIDRTLERVDQRRRDLQAAPGRPYDGIRPPR
ncbi:MAG: hypothetical protein EA406_02155 [Rhodospirillales bacterium]|nr:MAG: hypothetical protein EA406_02155 [Rhodospirillales bacterium]